MTHERVMRPTVIQLASDDEAIGIRFQLQNCDFGNRFSFALFPLFVRFFFLLFGLLVLQTFIDDLTFAGWSRRRLLRQLLLRLQLLRTKHLLLL